MPQLISSIAWGQCEAAGVKDALHLGIDQYSAIRPPLTEATTPEKSEVALCFTPTSNLKKEIEKPFNDLGTSTTRFCISKGGQSPAPPAKPKRIVFDSPVPKVNPNTVEEAVAETGHPTSHTILKPSSRRQLPQGGPPVKLVCFRKKYGAETEKIPLQEAVGGHYPSTIKAQGVIESGDTSTSDPSIWEKRRKGIAASFRPVSRHQVLFDEAIRGTQRSEPCTGIKSIFFEGKMYAFSLEAFHAAFLGVFSNASLESLPALNYSEASEESTIYSTVESQGSPNASMLSSQEERVHGRDLDSGVAGLPQQPQDGGNHPISTLTLLQLLRLNYLLGGFSLATGTYEPLLPMPRQLPLLGLPYLEGCVHCRYPASGCCAASGWGDCCLCPSAYEMNNDVWRRFDGGGGGGADYACRAHPLPAVPLVESYLYWEHYQIETTRRTRPSSTVHQPPRGHFFWVHPAQVQHAYEEAFSLLASSAASSSTTSFGVQVEMTRAKWMATAAEFLKAQELTEVPLLSGVMLSWRHHPYPPPDFVGVREDGWEEGDGVDGLFEPPLPLSMEKPRHEAEEKRTNEAKDWETELEAEMRRCTLAEIQSMASLSCESLKQCVVDRCAAILPSEESQEAFRDVRELQWMTTVFRRRFCVGWEAMVLKDRNAAEMDVEQLIISSHALRAAKSLNSFISSSSSLAGAPSLTHYVPLLLQHQPDEIKYVYVILLPDAVLDESTELRAPSSTQKIRSHRRLCYACSLYFFPPQSIVVLDGSEGVELGKVLAVEKKKHYQRLEKHQKNAVAPILYGTRNSRGLDVFLHVSVYRLALSAEKELLESKLPQLNAAGLALLRRLQTMKEEEVFSLTKEEATGKEKQSTTMSSGEIQKVQFRRCGFQADGKVCTVQALLPETVTCKDLSIFLSRCFPCDVEVIKVGSAIAPFSSTSPNPQNPHLQNGPIRRVCPPAPRLGPIETTSPPISPLRLPPPSCANRMTSASQKSGTKFNSLGFSSFGESDAREVPSQTGLQLLKSPTPLWHPFMKPQRPAPLSKPICGILTGPVLHNSLARFTASFRGNQRDEEVVEVLGEEHETEEGSYYLSDQYFLHASNFDLKNAAEMLHRSFLRLSQVTAHSNPLHRNPSKGENEKCYFRDVQLAQRAALKAFHRLRFDPPLYHCCPFTNTDEDGRSDPSACTKEGGGEAREAQSVLSKPLNHPSSPTPDQQARVENPLPGYLYRLEPSVGKSGGGASKWVVYDEVGFYGSHTSQLSSDALKRFSSGRPQLPVVGKESVNYYLILEKLRGGVPTCPVRQAKKQPKELDGGRPDGEKRFPFVHRGTGGNGSTTIDGRILFFGCASRRFSVGDAVVMDGDMGVELARVLLTIPIADYTNGWEEWLSQQQKGGGKEDGPIYDDEYALLFTAMPNTETHFLRSFVYRCAFSSELVHYATHTEMLNKAVMHLLGRLQEEQRRQQGASIPSRGGEGPESEIQRGGYPGLQARGSEVDGSPLAHFEQCEISHMHFLNVLFQPDGKKLIVQYYVTSPVRFLELATFLYHVFRVRVWMNEL